MTLDYRKPVLDRRVEIAAPGLKRGPGLAGRLHARGRIAVDAHPATDTPRGSRLFQARNPVGVSVTYLQWLQKGEGRK